MCGILERNVMEGGLASLQVGFMMMIVGASMRRMRKVRVRVRGIMGRAMRTREKVEEIWTRGSRMERNKMEWSWRLACPSILPD